jgi:hypothetical protein
MTQNAMLDLQVTDAQCAVLWEEDFEVEGSHKDADGTYRARSHCTYGCGCFVGYMFTYEESSPQ